MFFFLQEVIAMKLVFLIFIDSLFTLQYKFAILHYFFNIMNAIAKIKYTSRAINRHDNWGVDIYIFVFCSTDFF